MSEALTSLCSVLLREFFGTIVQEVGTYLMKQVSSCPLFLIVHYVSLPVDKVKSSLCVLIQHNLCEFMQDEKGFIEYTVKQENVLMLLHYERYAYCVHLLYGDPADLLVEEILNNGKLIMSEAIQKVVERLQDAKDTTGIEYSSKAVQDKFVELVKHHFLIRCPYPHPSENKLMPSLTISECEMFVVPEIKLHLLETNFNEDSPAKKQKIEFPDSGVYWKINHVRFKEHFRNEAIINACSNQIDEKAAEIVKTILLLSEEKSGLDASTTNPVPHYEILQKFQMASIRTQDLDSYLSILCEGEKSFISKADDRSGGMYVVNLEKVFRKLIESIAALVVQDRFGSKCARIFRILLEKKALEPKQIEELAMLPPKDTKDYIYRMFEENFIISHDVPKGSDFSHGQTLYLLRIDIVQVCRMILERCHQAIFNLITCSETQNQENKRLLEKKQRVDAIVASLRQDGADEDQIEEVQHIITPPEEAVINKVNSITQKIDSSQIQIAETLLTLSIWLEHCKVQ